MTYQSIEVQRHDRVRWVTLNRPQVLNAYDSSMCRELAAELVDYQRCDEDRVLVLTGAGRAFSAGGDIRSAEEAEEGETRQLGHAMVMREGMHAVNRLLYGLDKPTIALVNGVAVAGGLTLALLCDFRIAGASARLGDTSGRFGLLPDEGGAWIFPRVMGHEAALRMTLLGELYDAEEALRLGLVSEVVPDDDLAARGDELAAQLAAQAPLAVRLAKRMMRRGRSQTFDDALGDAEYAVDIANDSADVHEGVAAFVERRPPLFTGG
ncbi:MAG: short chain enoyl-CoA hydratase [Nocardioides sp.]|nr:short chain enoyl-CoA hydratase [Nocardioides sp.]